MLNISAAHIPTVLILRGTRNLQTQYEIARGLFANVREVGAPNGLIESVFIGELKGRLVGFACVYGAPMASEIVHIFGVLGTRAVIQTGNCGALADGLVAGDLFVPSEAFCGEGAGQYYKPDGQRVAASSEILSSETFTRHGGVPLHRGAIYTTAAAGGRRSGDCTVASARICGGGYGNGHNLCGCRVLWDGACRNSVCLRQPAMARAFAAERSREGCETRAGQQRCPWNSMPGTGRRAL